MQGEAVPRRFCRLVHALSHVTVRHEAEACIRPSLGRRPKFPVASVVPYLILVQCTRLLKRKLALSMAYINWRPQPALIGYHDKLTNFVRMADCKLGGSKSSFVAGSPQKSLGCATKRHVPDTIYQQWETLGSCVGTRLHLEGVKDSGVGQYVEDRCRNTARLA